MLGWGGEACLAVKTNKLIGTLSLQIGRAGHSLFFPGSLSPQFLSMDRHRSIAHYADFQVRSSLNRFEIAL